MQMGRIHDVHPTKGDCFNGGRRHGLGTGGWCYKDIHPVFSKKELVSLWMDKMVPYG